MNKITNETNENKLWYVFSKAKATKLREMGFRIVERKPSYKFPEFDMYGFENTSEFQKAFKEVLTCK